MTLRLKLNEPVLLGTPEILPLDGLTVKGGGNAPLVIPHTRVPKPPETETV